MSNSIWLILYDVAAENEQQYLDWFHDVHIPEKLARPGYEWAAHYELITLDGRPALLDGTAASAKARGFMAFFGGEDARTFLNPSPAQIKPTQPPLTREMMGLRVGSKSLIASEEWRVVSEAVAEIDRAYIDVSICDVGQNDEDYGAWCIQALLPQLSSFAEFESLAKLLSTTNAGKHLTVASFRSPAAIEAARAGPRGDAWWKRVREYRTPAAGTPMLGRRIWPQMSGD
jgi:hypothetical protein